MEIMDIKTTSLEVDRKTWVFSNGNSIPFSEIEKDIQDKMKNVKIKVWGEYYPENINIEPKVYLQVDYEGYHFIIMLEKQLFENYYKDIEDYYEYLVEKIAVNFARKFFIKEK